MLERPYLSYGYLLALSFLLAVGLTFAMRRLAAHWQILDHPGERKIHRDPVPLLGGVAIVATFYVVILGHLLALLLLSRTGSAWLQENLSSYLGENSGPRRAYWCSPRSASSCSCCRTYGCRPWSRCFGS